MSADPIILAEPCTTQRPPPRNLAEADGPLFAPSAVYTSNTVALKTLRKVDVSTEGRLFRGLSMLAEGFVVPQHRKRRRAILGTFTHLMTRGFPRKIDRAWWVSDNWSHEYFHWLCDALPRLYLAARHEPGLILLLPANHAGRNYISASARALLRTEPIIMRRGTSARVTELLLPGHAAWPGNYNDALMPALAKALTDALVPSAGADGALAPWRRIYISRSRGPRRRIVNETEIIGPLKAHGFETYYFEELAFEEQVRLMTETRTLVSNHGAGLTNMMFMQKGCGVLELRRTDDPNNCFFCLAAASRLPYFYQLCPAVDPAQSYFTSDIVVDPKALDRNLGLLAAAAANASPQ